MATVAFGPAGDQDGIHPRKQGGEWVPQSPQGESIIDSPADSPVVGLWRLLLLLLLPLLLQLLLPLVCKVRRCGVTGQPTRLLVQTRTQRRH